VWLDALLAYAHFIAIMLICSFLGAEALLLRTELKPKTIEILAYGDMGYFLSAGLVLLSGALRLGLSPKGFMFYAGNLVLWGKLGLFFGIALLSLLPTRRFVSWRHKLRMDPGFQVPVAEVVSTRRLVFIELHLLALLPLLAVAMSRGIGQ
jgi:putative membrane protein